MAVIRILTIFIAVIVIGLLEPQPAAAQESQDNQPHIQPREGQAKTKQQPRGTQPPAQPHAQAQPTPPPMDDEEPGESSSKDSQIDLNTRPPSRDRDNAANDPSSQLFDPHRAMKDIEVGNYYLKQKNYRAALDRFHDALQYKPGDAEATYGLAVTQEKLDLPSQAYKNYKKYLEILPNGPQSKDAQEALKRLASRVDPSVANSDQGQDAAKKIEIGESLLASNKYDEAREQFEDAMRLTPENPLIYFRLAQSLRGMQRLGPARNFFQKYLELQSNGPFAADAKKGISDINYILGK
ncbi:MAG: tetratricopeptide repeat protein [Acidobacteriia bacterium]|nr:tetratricopeptide repeat protein [Terriglobia bacterium]